MIPKPYWISGSQDISTPKWGKAEKRDKLGSLLWTKLKAVFQQRKYRILTQCHGTEEPFHMPDKPCEKKPGPNWDWEYICIFPTF